MNIVFCSKAVATYLGSGILDFGCVNDDIILLGRILGLLELKLNIAQQCSLKLIKGRLHIGDLNGFIFAKELTSKILSRVGGWVGAGWIK